MSAQLCAEGRGRRGEGGQPKGDGVSPRGNVNPMLKQSDVVVQDGKDRVLACSSSVASVRRPASLTHGSRKSWEGLLVAVAVRLGVTGGGGERSAEFHAKSLCTRVKAAAFTSMKL